MVAARAWNADLPEAPLFQNAAQIMLRMDNNAGVIGDVSYLAADKCGFGMSNYWRYTLHGRNGLMEFTYNTGATVILGAPLPQMPQLTRLLMLMLPSSRGSRPA